MIDLNHLLPSIPPAEDSILVSLDMIMKIKVAELKAVYKNNKLGVGSKKKDLQEWLRKILDDSKELLMKPITETNTNQTTN